MKKGFCNIFNSVLFNGKSRKHREELLLVFDTTMIVVAYTIAIFLKANLSYEETFYDFQVGIRLAPMIIIIHILMLILFKVHKSLWNYFGIKEVKNIVISIFCSAIIIMFYGYFIEGTTVIITYVILSEIIAVLLIFTVRFVYRAFRETRFGTLNRINVLIIGAGDGGYLMLREIISEKKHENVVGFVDDFRLGKILSGYKVLGSTSQIEEIVKKYNVKKVYIAMPSVDLRRQRQLYDICQKLSLEIKIMKKTDHRIGTAKGHKFQYPVEDISIDDLLGRGVVKLNHDEVTEMISGKNVLVTGAGGSIGSELCRQIIKKNPSNLIMLDLNENALYLLELELKSKHNNKDTKIHTYIASVRDYDAINKIIEKREVDLVFHAAAHKHVPLMESRPQEAIKNNIIGTKNVIEACIANCVDRFVLISTDKAVNPTNIMGASKRMCEMLLQANGNNGVTKMGAVRFGNVLGSNGSVIPIFNEQIRNGGPVEVTHENITRYFMTIPEAAQLVLQAGVYANAGEIFVLDMGTPVKIYDLAEKLIQLSGYRPHEDIEIVIKGLRPGEKMYEELSLESEKCEKTENDLIFINFPNKIDRDDLYRKIEQLVNMIDQYSKTRNIKEYLMECIKEEQNNV